MPLIAVCVLKPSGHWPQQCHVTVLAKGSDKYSGIKIRVDIPYTVRSVINWLSVGPLVKPTSTITEQAAALAPL